MSLANGSLPTVTYVRKFDVNGWHQTLCEAFSQTRYSPGLNQDFRGELTHASMGFARFSRILSPSGAFERDTQAIRRDSFDGFVILMCLRGELRIRQGDRQALARHDEALIYRHGTPFELEFPEHYRALSMWVRPDLMERHCPEIVKSAPMVIRANSINGMLALSVIRELCDSAVTQKAVGADQLVGATLDIVSTLKPRETTEGSRNQWLLEKLSRYVEKNVDDTTISLGNLVEVSGMSARSLNRAFAEQGTTPMRWVWDRRLSMAHDALMMNRVRNVTEAAFSFGFKDSSHFSRAFSSRYGVTPAAVLKKG